MAGILALLIAVLLPSLTRARALARTTACLSNTRQLAVAAHMYADAHKGVIVDAGLPHGGLPSLPQQEAASWFHTLRGHYRDPLTARCPSDRSPHWDSDLPGTSPPVRRRVSFAQNDFLTGDVPGWESFNHTGRIKRPASTILLAELTETGSWAASDHIHVELWLLNPREEAGQQIAFTRHLDRANYAFVDGHAAQHTFEQTYSLSRVRREEGRLVPEWRHNYYDPKVAY